MGVSRAGSRGRRPPGCSSSTVGWTASSNGAVTTPLAGTAHDIDEVSPAPVSRHVQRPGTPVRQQTGRGAISGQNVLCRQRHVLTWEEGPRTHRQPFWYPARTAGRASTRFVAREKRGSGIPTGGVVYS